MLYPLKFNPILKSAIWGGEKLIPYKGLTTSQTEVGESWELSGVTDNESIVANGELAGKSIPQLIAQYGAALVGERNLARFGNEFPLLIKFIDAKQDLSIQVHPNDELAAKRHNSKGKTEMWYVVDCDESAHLRSGFSKEVTPQQYVESVEQDTITTILQEYDVKKGDLFFLPAGRIHSIGAGCFIAEIQQTSNITYRIYDFNRTDAAGNPRELHTELAKDAIDYTLLDDYRTHYDNSALDTELEVVECDYFKTSLYSLTKDMSIDYTSIDSFVIYICMEGAAVIESAQGTITLNSYETILLPAATTHVTIKTNGCKIMSTWV